MFTAGLGSVKRAAGALRDLEIIAQSEDLKNAQRNIKMAQIGKSRGTHTSVRA